MGAAKSAATGLAAAALFGASVPLAKLLLPGASPGVLAGLLYLGAGVALTLVRALRQMPMSADSAEPSESAEAAEPSASAEAPIRRADLPLLAAVILAGGIAGPVLLLMGLSRTAGASASLLLALEAPLTVLIAVTLGDHLTLRAGAGIALVLAGGVPLALAEGAGGASISGALLLAGASLAWAVENNLTQKLSLKDPAQITQLKGLCGGGFTLAVSLLLGEHLPAATAVTEAALLGAVSYGLSVAWHIRAVRDLGAARQAGLFATAPLFGAALSVALLGDRFPLLSAALMATGVLLMLYERHQHRHSHQRQTHEHAHVHDAHHQHPHPAGSATTEPHSHLHEHGPLDHEHPHWPDAHHRHPHGHGSDHDH